MSMSQVHLNIWSMFWCGIDINANQHVMDPNLLKPFPLMPERLDAVMIIETYNLKNKYLLKANTLVHYSERTVGNATKQTWSQHTGLQSLTVMIQHPNCVKYSNYPESLFSWFKYTQIPLNTDPRVFKLYVEWWHGVTFQRVSRFQMTPAYVNVR